MSEEKKKYDKPLQYVDLTYIGKQWHRDFNNEDGSVIKSYKYQFKEKPEDQFPKNFWGYGTTKGADILEEGKVYTIGYTEKDIEVQGKPAKLKSAKFFGEPSKGGSGAEQGKEDAIDSKAELPDELKGEWFEKIKSKADGFLDTFVDDKILEGQREPTEFYVWMDDPQKCETNIIQKARDVGVDEQTIKTLKKRIFDAIVRELII